LEAIAAGVPTILPETFSEIFGEAAIYAEPAQMLDVVKRLWGDKEAYAAQVTRGLNFIAANYGIERFAARVRPYLSDVQDSVQVPSGHPDRYNGSVSLHAGSRFNAAEYWENRHRKYRESLRSVGHVNLSEADSLEGRQRAWRGPLGDCRCQSKGPCAASSVRMSVSGSDAIRFDFRRSGFDGRALSVVDDALWEAAILRMIAAIKPGGFLLIQESFNMPGEAHFPHLRWRNLEDYRRVLAATGARISAVEAYPIPHECTVKTVLTIECACEAPQLDTISSRSELAVLPS
jgi:hypothetical protein